MRSESLAHWQRSTQCEPHSRQPPPTNPDGPDARAQGDGARLLHKGTSLGRYVLLEKLGSGGMGDVFAAYDPQLDRKVALKLLRPEAVADPDRARRFLLEAKAAARFSR